MIIKICTIEWIVLLLPKTEYSKLMPTELNALVTVVEKLEAHHEFSR